MMPCHPEPLNPPGESAHAEASQVFITQGRVSKNYMHRRSAPVSPGNVFRRAWIVNRTVCTANPIDLRETPRLTEKPLPDGLVFPLDPQ